jgi:hypothetical protein
LRHASSSAVPEAASHRLAALSAMQQLPLISHAPESCSRSLLFHVFSRIPCTSHFIVVIVTVIGIVIVIFIATDAKGNAFPNAGIACRAPYCGDRCSGSIND